ncbi:MAG TPA: efflux RND transporter periplasmic adaptor subunit [Terracidiphilus sp.]
MPQGLKPALLLAAFAARLKSCPFKTARTFKTAGTVAWGKAGWLLVFGAAVPLLMLSGCKKESAPETVVSVQAEHPERGSIAEHVETDAVLSPVAQAAIVPKITAPVEKFYVQRGAKVHAGELLATLENGDLTAAALDSKGSYEAAQGAYATATKSQIPEEVLAAQAAADQAQSNLKLNEEIVKSRTELLAQGAIAQHDLDTAKTALVQAQGTYDSAEKHLNAVKSVNEQAAVEQAKGQLTSAEGKYKGAEAQVGYSEIRSPINGVIADRPLFAGETATAGTPLLTVMDTTTLIAKAHIAQSVAQELKVGGEATITAPGVAKPVPAKISMISPALDPGSTTVEIWLKVDNRKGELKAGTPVKATITGRSVADALKIPVGAIQTAQDGSKFVMVVGSDGKAQKKPVTLGIVNEEDAQVTSGITAADQVITVGAYALDANTKVKVGPADAAGGGND